MNYSLMFMLAFSLLLVCGCSNSDDDDPIVGNSSSVVAFTMTIENVSPDFTHSTSGSFSVPVGAGAAGPIDSGGAYEVEFCAAPGSSFTFATMFIPSNDFFFAPDESGIALFNPDGSQVSGDVTSQVFLWDAGTEINQEPGVGVDQVQRQAAPNTGALDPDSTVRLAPDTFANLPAVSSVIEVTITPIIDGTGTTFRVRIENVSTATTLATSAAAPDDFQSVPMSPGVFSVHSGVSPLFTSGLADFGEGLEGVAEDGVTTTLAGNLAIDTGLVVPLSPGVVVLHTGLNPIFTSGSPDLGEGLEALAEDGVETTLDTTKTSQIGTNGIIGTGTFNTPTGATTPGAIGPGGSYQITIFAFPGEAISFATMFVASNDFFFGPGNNGIEMFDASGIPISGDITSQVLLWDAGTEINQKPGVGLDQVQRQAAANTGALDPDNTVRLAPDTFGNLPANSQIIRVTITPN